MCALGTRLRPIRRQGRQRAPPLVTASTASASTARTGGCARLAGCSSGGARDNGAEGGCAQRRLRRDPIARASDGCRAVLRGCTGRVGPSSRSRRLGLRRELAATTRDRCSRSGGGLHAAATHAGSSAARRLAQRTAPAHRVVCRAARRGARLELRRPAGRPRDQGGHGARSDRCALPAALRPRHPRLPETRASGARRWGVGAHALAVRGRRGDPPLRRRPRAGAGRPPWHPSSRRRRQSGPRRRRPRPVRGATAGATTLRPARRV